jgi:hypothetical protein
MTMMRICCLPALACVAWLSGTGCGGAGLPAQERTDAVAAVRSARELGAESTPQASYHLALADGEMTEADTLIQHGRMEAAQRMLERAKADAELAMALQREADVRAHALETHEHIEDQRDSQLRTDGK